MQKIFWPITFVPVFLGTLVLGAIVLDVVVFLSGLYDSDDIPLHVLEYAFLNIFLVVYGVRFLLR